MKQEYADLLNAARLDLLDCEVVGIYVRWNELTGQPDPNDRKPYEIVIGVPVSMGERGINISMYYDTLPTAEELYMNTRTKLKDFCEFNYAGFDADLRSKTVRKVLRTAPKKWAEIKGGV